MVILENIDIDIDIDKAILQNIDIDKISNRFKFGISNRASRTPNGKCHLKFPFWFFAHLPKDKLRAEKEHRKDKDDLHKALLGS